MSANNSTYTWDETPRYDLTTAIVNTFLKELFGNFEFFTNQPNAETFRFWVPRKLTDDEKNKLKERGLRAAGY